MNAFYYKFNQISCFICGVDFLVSVFARDKTDINKDAIDVNQNYLNHGGDLVINFVNITKQKKIRENLGK